MMKTIKNLIGVVLLVMLTTSAFSMNPFMPQANSFSKLKYYSLTTSYTVHVAWDDRGPSGQVVNGVAYRNYSQYMYITDTATPGYTNRVTVPGDFTVNADIVITYGGIPVSSTGMGTIYSGNSYQREDYDDIPPTTYSVVSGTAVLSVTSYGGVPIYFDYTVENY